MIVVLIGKTLKGVSVTVPTDEVGIARAEHDRTRPRV